MDIQDKIRSRLDSVYGGSLGLHSLSLILPTIAELIGAQCQRIVDTGIFAFLQTRFPFDRLLKIRSKCSRPTILFAGNTGSELSAFPAGENSGPCLIKTAACWNAT
jgi:hypothetical protein